ncbi:MAG TPA: hypothetical protein VEV15_10660, partial [Flavisolibacter sp.]|nr:hypothetical protein [Flavisolibacter sp.]
MKSVSAAVLLACLSWANVQAKDKNTETGSHQWANARSGGYSYKYVTGDPMQARFYKLDNGLTVILSPTHKEPRMQFFIATKAGSKTDPSDHTGLA